MAVWRSEERRKGRWRCGEVKRGGWKGGGVLGACAMRQRVALYLSHVRRGVHQAAGDEDVVEETAVQMRLVH